MAANATMQQNADADRLFGQLRNLKNSLTDAANSVTAFATVVDGLQAADLNQILAVLADRGYTTAEITNLYNAVKTTRDNINTNLSGFNVNSRF